MAANIAFIFPGQGSQSAGMGRELAEQFPVAAQVFAEADATLGWPLSRLCFEGPDEQLKLTANTQPAILTVSVAASRVLEQHGVQPAIVAGHSLGEYSALVASGGLQFADALRLVRRRGELMQQAVPEGAGAMAAILGLASADVEAHCRAAAHGQVCAPANFNSAEHTVIAGDAAAVERCCELVIAAGGRAIRLPVSAPFHCSLMRPAQQALEPDLQRTPFSPLRVPLITNVDAQSITAGHVARERLIRQIVAPVLWERSMQVLLAAGVTHVVEVGPGRVLSGLLRRMDRSRKPLNVEDRRSLDATLTALQPQ